MSDPFDTTGHDDISRLLRASRATEPVPADVAARLDATLASLTAAEAPAVSGSRWASRGLVAAAAVLVLAGSAVGVTQLLRNETTQSTADSVAAGGSSSSRSESGGHSPVPPGAPRSSGTSPANGLSDLAENAPTLSLSRADFASATRSFSAQDSTSTSAGAPGNPLAKIVDRLARSTESRPAPNARPGCAGPTPGPGESVLSIRFEGRPALLVVGPSHDGSRRVSAWACDGSRRLASALVPAG